MKYNKVKRCFDIITGVFAITISIFELIDYAVINPYGYSDDTIKLKLIVNAIKSIVFALTHLILGILLCNKPKLLNSGFDLKIGIRIALFVSMLSLFFINLHFVNGRYSNIVAALSLIGIASGIAAISLSANKNV
ncbi:MAG: hypothetical protein J6Y43_05645 [Clostridia bacterium]|nr:hypothetical protein [Clostridia bacterium]